MCLKKDELNKEFEKAHAISKSFDQCRLNHSYTNINEFIKHLGILTNISIYRALTSKEETFDLE